jgi:hypothetical protein
MWLLIGMIPLTKIPEIHSSMNDINIETLALAGGEREKQGVSYVTLNCQEFVT